MQDRQMGKQIAIVGGGTAGWITAALVNHHLKPHGFDVVLIESPDIGIIGVGEGSTPQLKQLFELLGIPEHVWMSKCNATFKNGIRFEKWTQHTHFDSYFHPFPSPTDHQTARAFLANCHQQFQGVESDSHPDLFFLAAELASTGKSPKVSAGNAPLPLNYAYHFDSVLLGQFLRDFCIAKGVTHISATVDQINQHPNGDIASVQLASGDLICADWFFDCSGFRSLLVQQQLNTRFIPFKENLFNDAAVAIGTSIDQTFHAQTTATALTNGWKWHIPLQHRTGNGYVYSTEYCSPQQAEAELRASLGVAADECEARHLSMNVGRCENTWVANAIAVGLSQGFIEPLEATALHIVQTTVEQFISAFTAGNFSAVHREQFNQRINARIDGIRDYIVCHYQASDRLDTDYWRAASQCTNRSDSLQHILDVWDKGGNLIAEIERQQIGQYYPVVSWYCLLSGYGRFKSKQRVNASAATTNIRKHLQSLTPLFQDHHSSLSRN